MTKKQLIDRLVELNNGHVFMTRQKAAESLGVGKPKINRMLESYTPVYRTQGGRNLACYLIDDIADAVMKGGLK